jgi:hypothetical protein
MQKLKIDVKKIDKSALFEGKSGTYLDVTLFENKDGPGKYGDDGFIVQEISKERREAGEKGPIIGNWRHHGSKAGWNDKTASEAKRVTPPPTPPKAGYQPDQNDATDDIPF